jgi:hypothetical protein
MRLTDATPSGKLLGRLKEHKKNRSVQNTSTVEAQSSSAGEDDVLRDLVPCILEGSWVQNSTLTHPIVRDDFRIYIRRESFRSDRELPMFRRNLFAPSSG